MPGEDEETDVVELDEDVLWPHKFTSGSYARERRRVPGICDTWKRHFERSFMYKINVEPDSLEKGKFMVTIRREGVIVGIPRRCESRKVAESLKDTIRFSFEYGLTEARLLITTELNSVHIVCE